MSKSVCDVCGRADCSVALRERPWPALAEEIEHWRIGYERQKARASSARAAALEEAAARCDRSAPGNMDADDCTWLARELAKDIRRLAASVPPQPRPVDLGPAPEIHPQPRGEHHE